MLPSLQPESSEPVPAAAARAKLAATVSAKAKKRDDVKRVGGDG